MQILERLNQGLAAVELQRADRQIYRGLHRLDWQRTNQIRNQAPSFPNATNVLLLRRPELLRLC